MGTSMLPFWMLEKPINELPRRVKIKASEINPTILSSMGFNQLHPAPETLDAIEIPRARIKEPFPFTF